MLRVVFLDASDDSLVRRFEQVRRPHPLQGDGTLLDGIVAERRRMEEIRESSDVVIDTSDLNIHQLATTITERFAEENAAGLRVTLVSFGYKYGLPSDSGSGRRLQVPPEPVLGARAALITPGWTVPCASSSSASQVPASSSPKHAKAMEPVFAGYQRENKRHVTIAIGCTGGKHRSVTIAEELGRQVARTARCRREREASRSRPGMTADGGVVRWH